MHNRIEQLYRKHHQHALRALKHQLHGTARDQAEDALTEAWMILDRKLTERDDYIRADSELVGWLITVAKRKGINDARHEQRAADLELGELTANIDTDEVVMRRERVRALLDLLSDPAVSINRRRALAARMIGLSYTEACELQNRSYTSINRDTTEGRAIARDRIQAL